MIRKKLSKNKKGIRLAAMALVLMLTLGGITPVASFAKDDAASNNSANSTATDDENKKLQEELKQKEEELKNLQEQANKAAEDAYTRGQAEGAAQAAVTNPPEPENKTTPRIMVTGFTTTPAEVKAGTDFTLNITLKNTSGATAIRNMMVNLVPTSEGDKDTVAPSFLPVSGSNSIFVDSIGANGTKNVSIKLNAKGDLLQKPYSIDLAMKYEDSEGNPFDSTSSLSIPVKQDVRFEFSKVEVNPEQLAVGSDGNVSCNLYNLGKIKLYNVKAKIEGKGITSDEVFLGHVESGATASIDATVKAEKAGEIKAKLILTYEDENGKQSKFEKELPISVVAEAPVAENMSADMGMAEEPKGSPIGIIIPVVILAVIAVITVVIIRKKRKNKKKDEEDLLDEI